MIDIALISNVTRETEKAIQFDAGDRLVWVPKSLIEVDGDVILCKKWFAKKNGIGKYGATTVLVG